MKFAARQITDKAGHDGPITSGSHNVTTGGYPSARLGDSFICKAHGPGVISEGSKTVTINGIPAARMGDKVICGKKSLPLTKGPKPPENNNITLVKNTNEDGSVKVQKSKEFKMNVLLASSQLSDGDGNGNFDTANNKIVAEDFQLSHPMGDNDVNFNLGGAIGKVEMIAGTTSGEKGSSAVFNVKSTGVSGNIALSEGTEGSGKYTELKAEGTVGLAETKAETKIINDEVEHQYGFKAELGAEVAAAKGEIKIATELKYLRIKGNISGSAGSASMSGGVGAIADIDNLMIKVNIIGAIAVCLGVGGDIEIQLGPLFPPSAGGSGIITSGLGTVIIGG